MKLYFSPGACSLSPHIALREAGLPFDLVQVSLSTKKAKDGSDFKAKNPKGYVPTLELDGGEILTEGPAIVQYVADQKPESNLAPPNGSMQRYHLQEWLNFISTELHKQFSPLFSAKTPDEVKAAQRERLGGRFDYLTERLGDRPWLMGETFTVADGYLYTVLRWAALTGIDLAKWPALVAFQQRAEARASVKAALEAEGIAGKK
jgi:glutathione S-transferase